MESGNRNFHWLPPGRVIQVCQQNSPLPYCLWLHTSVIQSEWQSLSSVFYKHKLRPNCKGSGHLVLVLGTYSRCDRKCTDVNRSKGVCWCAPTSMGQFHQIFQCISLSSCQLHKPILTIIKIRSLLCTLQAASHNVLHMFIQTVEVYRSRELKICSLWSSNQGNVSEKLATHQRSKIQPDFSSPYCKK